LAAAETSTEQYPTAAEIAASQASVLPYSPVSNVKGLAFDRFVDIWIENTVSNHLSEKATGSGANM
jgi:acid phosphatase